MRKTTIILSILAALLGTGVWLAGRESTLIWVGEWARAALDGRLKVEGLHGSLLGSISAQQIEFQGDDTKFVATGATLRWRPVALLAGTLSLPRIAADAVEVSLPPPTPQPPPTPPKSLALPLRVSLGDVTVHSIDIRRGSSRFPLTDVALSVTGAKAWQLHLHSLATPWGKAQGEATIDADPAPFPMSGRFALSADGERGYAVSATLSGTLLRPELAATGEAQGAHASAAAVLAPFAANVLERFTLQAEGINPRAWHAAAPQADLRLQANAQAAPETADGAIRGEAIVENAAPGTLDRDQLPLASLHGTFANVGQSFTLSDIVLDLGAGGRLAGGGEVKDGVVDLRLRTDALNLRGLQGKLRATKLRGDIGASGNGATQKATLALREGDYRFHLDAGFDGERLTVNQAQASGGGGEFSANGSLALDERKAFAIKATLRRFDPSRFGDYAKALINASAKAQGELAPVLQVRSDVALTDSQLFGLPAHVSGKVRSKGLDKPDVALDVTGKIGATQATLRGTMADPQHLHAMDLSLSIAGGDLAQLYPIVGVPLPPTPPYSLQGRLTQRDQVWTFRQFSGRVGRSDLAGDFVLDRRRTPQFMRADLVSDRLDMKDLAGFIGASGPSQTTAPTTPKAGNDRVLPTEPYSLEKLKAADADVRFTGRSILTEKWPLRDMTTHLRLAAGHLTLEPLDFGIAGGNIVSSISLDARQTPIATSADISVQGLQLNQLVPGVQMTQASVGRIDGRARLGMRGDSVAAMLGSANGDVALLTNGGEISDRLLRLINLDIANTLVTFLRGDRNIAIHCMVGEFSAKDGVMGVRTLVFDTQHTNLSGTGSVDFRNEALDLRLVAKPKDNSLAALRGPIVIGGRFASPSVRPDLPGVTVRTGAALLLGVVATPPAALIPLVELGGGKDTDCAPLVAGARQFIDAATQTTNPSSH